MAELIKLNAYMIGNPESYNISSLMQTLMESYRGKDVFTLLNYNNDAGAPGLKGVAVIDVAGSLYILTEDTTALYRNGDASSGTIEDISNAPNGTYYLMLTESVNGLQIIAASLIDADFIYNHDYSGYYERYTTNKIIGKFTKTGSVYSNKMKLFNEGTALMWIRGDGYVCPEKIHCNIARINNFEIGGFGLTTVLNNGQHFRLRTMADLQMAGAYDRYGVYHRATITNLSYNKIILFGMFVPGEYIYNIPSVVGDSAIITVQYALGGSDMTIKDIIQPL